MLRQTIVGIAVVAAGMSASIGYAEDAKQLRLTPSEAQAVPSAGQTGTSGVAGVQMRPLAGSPKQSGLYTIMIKVPKGTTIKPHSHPDDRSAVVVQGTFYFAFGDTFDESALKALSAGSFYTEPPGANHFAMTKDEDVVVYITGAGPTGTTYANPADDPNKK